MPSESIHSQLAGFIEKGELPKRAEEFLPLILDENQGRFSYQEDVLIDYKDRWPFSYSDDYFYGLARLVCAFHNTYGGLIIFGVDDTTREVSADRVRANLEKFNSVLNALLTEPVACGLQQYNFKDFPRSIDCLIVPRRSQHTLPIRPRADMGKHKAGTIWIRKGHEVERASSSQMAILYGDESEINSRPSMGFIPPSPTSMTTFVGRLEEIDQIFRWIKSDTQPRKFLWGKGGSGKTTIAYEVARFLSQYGTSIETQAKTTFDTVIFVTAKKLYLDVESATALEYKQKDFQTEDDLYEALLLLAEFASYDDIKSWNKATLRAKFDELLDERSCFIVIDDIDTLSGSEEEFDFDSIYASLIRAKKLSRILFTQRNRPTQSLKNAIEVPGLRRGTEFEPFLDACCTQMGVPLPQSHEITEKIAALSEQRPLVVETIVALRKHSSTYENALATFEERGGDESRRYVFGREWDRLAPDNRGRNLLAALAFLNEYATTDDLKVILQWDQGTVLDAMSDVAEMFLVRQNTGDQTKFALGVLTRDFVLSVATGLSFAEAIKARVKHFKAVAFNKPGQVARLEIESSRLVYRNDPRAAQRLLREEKLPPVVREHPAFKSLQGWVAVKQQPPELQAAREYFRYCQEMGGTVPEAHVTDWMRAEFHSEVGWDVCEEICSYVRSSSHFGSKTKCEFRLWEGSVAFSRARQHESTEPTEALRLYRRSLERHVAALSLIRRSGSPLAEKSEKYAIDTAYRLFSLALQLGQDEEVFNFWAELKNSNEPLSLDGLIEPMRGFVARLVSRLTPGQTRVISGRLSQVRSIVDTSLRNYFGHDDSRAALSKVLADGAERAKKTVTVA